MIMIIITLTIIILLIIIIIILFIIIFSMSLILHAVERLGIDLDSEESEYDAYVFYQVSDEFDSFFSMAGLDHDG